MQIQRVMTVLSRPAYGQIYNVCRLIIIWKAVVIKEALVRQYALYVYFLHFVNGIWALERDTFYDDWRRIGLGWVVIC